MSYSFSHQVLPRLLPAGWGQCYNCGAEYHENDAHLMYSDGCALCKVAPEEREDPRDLGRGYDPDHDDDTEARWAKEGRR